LYVKTYKHFQADINNVICQKIKKMIPKGPFGLATGLFHMLEPLTPML